MALRARWVPAPLSDARCRLSTGGGYATRKLYANTEETILDAMRPVVLTGIDDLATRPDLLDRSIMLSLPRIDAHMRATERELFDAFEEARPRILGALLTAASGALANLGRTHIEGAPRNADFAARATAGETAAGLEPGAFLAAYRENRVSANSLALDASPLPQQLTQFAERVRSWEGTAAELLGKLDRQAGDATLRHNAWPKSASALAQKLRRVAPNLREVGVNVEFVRTLTARIIRVSSANAVTPSQGTEELAMRRVFSRDGEHDSGRDGAVTEASAVTTTSRHEPRTARHGDGVDSGDGISPSHSWAPGSTRRVRRETLERLAARGWPVDWLALIEAVQE